MRGRKKHSDCGSHCEQREHDQTQSVHHHRRELPVAPHLIVFVLFPHLVRDHPDLLEDEVQFSGAGGHAGVDEVRVVHRVAPVRHAYERRVVGGVRVRQRVRAEVVVDVQHVRQERLGRPLLHLQFSHLVVQHDALARDLLSRAVNAQDPR